jgi:FMN phosphatase YigB (HAD superfamily)
MTPPKPSPRETVELVELRANELLGALEQHAEGLRVLSLDCFDTLLWRNTASPVDVFYDLCRTPPFERLGFNARLRVSAETTARENARVKKGKGEVDLAQIYRAAFPELSAGEVEALAEAELSTEIAACYPFPPVVELARAAKARGLRVVVVSDTYFKERDLRRLFDAVVPADVVRSIDAVFCSSEVGVAKSAGLFERVLTRLGEKPGALLHVGDHPIADGSAPRRAGIVALRLVHQTPEVEALMRLERTARSMLHPETRRSESLASPFHGVFACSEVQPSPERLLGYYGTGPVLYAFARFVLDRISAHEAKGQRVKPLFLLRDAYLPKRVCDAVAGRPCGQTVAISRFAALAASFRKPSDVERYLGQSAGSRRFDAMCRQLLLPESQASSLTRRANKSNDPAHEFVREVCKPAVLERVFERSQAFRARLFEYLERVVGIERGDTLLFVDLGYEGTAQRQLEPVLREELGVDIVGAYLLAVRTPGWERSRSGLLDPSWCDDRTFATLLPYMALVEDLCTADDASVVDYRDDGTPIRAERVVAGEQFARLAPVQDACVQFAQDAARFFAATGHPPSVEALRRSALGALGRLLFMPTEAETSYLEGFRLDMNLATDDSFQLFDRAKGLDGLRRRGLFLVERKVRTLRTNQPIELRSAGLELSLALLARHRYSLEFTQEDLSLRRETLDLLVARGQDTSSVSVAAHPTHDGYFAAVVAVGNCELSVGVLFGKHYEWVQIEAVELIAAHALCQLNESEHTADLSSSCNAEGMALRGDGLFECLDPSAFVFIVPRSAAAPPNNYVVRIVFRPIVRRGAATTTPG